MKAEASTGPPGELVSRVATRMDDNALLANDGASDENRLVTELGQTDAKNSSLLAHVQREVAKLMPVDIDDRSDGCPSVNRLTIDAAKGGFERSIEVPEQCRVALRKRLFDCQEAIAASLTSGAVLDDAMLTYPKPRIEPVNLVSALLPDLLATPNIDVHEVFDLVKPLLQYVHIVSLYLLCCTQIYLLRREDGTRHANICDRP